MKLIILILIILLFDRTKSSYGNVNPIIKTYEIVDLLENSPLNTFVIGLTEFSKNKLRILNLNEFERKYFSIINGNIYTNNEIDREEFLNKKYCLNKFNCQIEIHILVDDGLAYLVIPIHIVE